LKPKLEDQEKNESAEKEYAEILIAEQGGAEPKTLCNQYEAFIAKYAETPTATRARERLATLTAKVKESEQAMADQEKTQKAFEAERDRRLNQLRARMVEAAKQKGLEAHPLAAKDSASAEKHGDEHLTTDSNGKYWGIQQEYLVTVGAHIPAHETVACRGVLHYKRIHKGVRDFRAGQNLGSAVGSCRRPCPMRSRKVSDRDLAHPT
jgi:hypothetical protein